MNAKQEMFVREYVRDLNASKAALRAGYSPKTAPSQAHDLLKKPEIQEAIKKRMDARAQKVEVSTNDVLRELKRIAFQDLSGVIRVERGCAFITDTSVLTEDQMAIIKDIEQTDKGVRVRFHSKEKALELLARHLGMLQDKLEHSGKIDCNRSEAELEARLREIDEQIRSLEGPATRTAQDPQGTG